MGGSNQKALDLSLSVLSVGDESEAFVQAARSLAVAVDERPHSDELWREYRFALKALWEAVADGGDDDDPLDDVRAAVPDAPTP